MGRVTVPEDMDKRTDMDATAPGASAGHGRTRQSVRR
jgi:hypothetical protein